VGVARDEEQAARLYRRAAELGDADAMALLAQMCRDGRGVVSIQERDRWERQAAAATNLPGGARLAGPTTRLLFAAGERRPPGGLVYLLGTLYEMTNLVPSPEAQRHSEEAYRRRTQPLGGMRTGGY
jgi:TPR repeat protein